MNAIETLSKTAEADQVLAFDEYDNCWFLGVEGQFTEDAWVVVPGSDEFKRAEAAARKGYVSDFGLICAAKD